jgi:hypothetical protein
VLRAKGIIPPKKAPVEKELTEDEIVQMLDSTINERTGAGGNFLTSN